VSWNPKPWVQKKREKKGASKGARMFRKKTAFQGASFREETGSGRGEKGKKM